jgi:hypothetical protein
MLAETRQSAFDPEFDPPPPRWRREHVPLRLVVNPWLVVLDWLTAYMIVRAAVLRVNFTLFQLGCAVALLGFFLLQFHCLDCGATGWLLRFRRHHCPDGVAAWCARRPSRWPIPSVGTQIVAWCFALAMAVLLALIPWRG